MSITTPTPAQQVFLQHLDCLATGRAEDWVRLFTVDGVLDFPYAPAGFPGRVTGHEQLRAHITGFVEEFGVAFDDVTFHDTVDESLVIAELRGHGTSRTTGLPYEQVYVSIVRTKDGLIEHYADYWNPLALTASTDAEQLNRTSAA